MVALEEKRISRKEKVLAALFLLCLLIVYYHSVVIRGKSFMTTIERSYRVGQYHYTGTYWHEAWKHLSADPVAANQIILPSAYLDTFYLKSLQLPLWNPFSGLGRPYHADMNSYTFFLPIYLFKLFPSLITYDLFLLLRLFIAAFFLFLCLRLFGIRFWIALAGASFFMFNTHFFVFVDMDHLNVTMFLTPMVYFLTKSFLSNDKRYLLAFIFCSAGSFFGGNPNEYILIHVFVSLYFVFIVFLKKGYYFLKNYYYFLAYIGTLGLSFLLSSVKWIPFVEFWTNSLNRGTAGMAGLDTYLSFRKFLAWILVPDHIFHGPNYIGYLCLSLVFFSVMNLFRKRWRRKEKIVAFHVVLLVLVISKICNAPYIKWVGTLPFLSDINYVKYCSLIYYAAAVLLSFSLTYLAEDIKENKIWIKKICLFIFSCAAPHFLFLTISKESLFSSAEKGTTLLILSLLFVLAGFFLIFKRGTRTRQYLKNGAVIVLLLLVVCELRLNNHQFYRERFELNDKAPYTLFLLAQSLPYRAIGIDGTLSPNANLIYPISTVNRIFAMRVKRATYLLSRLVSQKFNSSMEQTYRIKDVLNNPYLDLLNLRYLISESVIDSNVIDPDYARNFKVEDLTVNPAMSYTTIGNNYSYTHSGWQQLSDSSVNIPVRLPYGDVFLHSTAIAYNFDWQRREDPNNELTLTISVKSEGREDIVYSRTFQAHRKKYQDFFPLEEDLSEFAGQEVVLNFTLRNPRAINRNDRSFFYGDLRITSNKRKKTKPDDRMDRQDDKMLVLENTPYEEVFFRHAIVYKNNRALDRGFMLYDVRQVEDQYEALEIMNKEPLLYKNTALIEGSYRRDMKIERQGRSKIDFIDYRPNYVKIDVDTTENGVFVLSDAYYPGWKARINKKKVKIYPAFGALRAIFVPKGKHEIEFAYRPWTFYLGALLSFLSFVFLGFLFFKSRGINKKSKGNVY